MIRVPMHLVKELVQNCQHGIGYALPFVSLTLHANGFGEDYKESCSFGIPQAFPTNESTGSLAVKVTCKAYSRHFDVTM